MERRSRRCGLPDAVGGLFQRRKLLNSDMLSRLIVLPATGTEKKPGWCFPACGARSVPILEWTKLDRFFEINDQPEQKAAALV